MQDEIFATYPKDNDPWDVGIIGSGPASLTAAIYTTRGAASTIIFGGSKWGGQLMLTSVVDNYPGFPKGIDGPELMANMRAQAQRFGAKFIEDDVVDFNIMPEFIEVKLSDKVSRVKTLIVATGAETQWLGVPGEKELIGRGVSSCAPCDAPFFKNKKVAVIGGGDSAMEEALVLSKYATEVTIIHRRDAFRASAAMQARVKTDPKIKILYNTQVQKIIGEQKVEKLELVNNSNNRISEVALDGVFVAIGHLPSTKIFEGKLELDEKGFIKKFTDEGYTTKTSIERIFVAGDVHDHHYKQAVTAAGFGCMAALDTIKYLDTKA